MRRVKLLQGAQFIYLHRGLPKLCIVDRQARCLSWGELQLIMRDTQQLNSVLAVLRHADVRHATVWPQQVSMLWLGPPEVPQRLQPGDEALVLEESGNGSRGAPGVSGGELQHMRATVGKDAAPDASSFSAWWPSAETLRSHAPNFTVLLLLGTAAAAAAAGLVWRSRARTW